MPVIEAAAAARPDFGGTEKAREVIADPIRKCGERNRRIAVENKITLRPADTFNRFQARMRELIFLAGKILHVLASNVKRPRRPFNARRPDREQAATTNG